jgi:TonB family protein
MRIGALLVAPTTLLLSLPAPAQTAMPATADAISTAHAQAPILIHRVEPRLPQEALRENINGVVTARLTLDAQGNVTDVAIVRAYPRRIFDRPTIEALSQWRFNNGAAGRSVESEIAFQVR